MQQTAGVKRRRIPLEQVTTTTEQHASMFREAAADDLPANAADLSTAKWIVKQLTPEQRDALRTALRDAAETETLQKGSKRIKSKKQQQPPALPETLGREMIDSVVHSVLPLQQQQEIAQSLADAIANGGVAWALHSLLNQVVASTPRMGRTELAARFSVSPQQGDYTPWLDYEGAPCVFWIDGDFWFVTTQVQRDCEGGLLSGKSKSADHYLDKVVRATLKVLVTMRSGYQPFEGDAGRKRALRTFLNSSEAFQCLMQAECEYQAKLSETTTNGTAAADDKDEVISIGSQDTRASSTSSATAEGDWMLQGHPRWNALVKETLAAVETPLGWTRKLDWGAVYPAKAKRVAAKLAGGVGKGTGESVMLHWTVAVALMLNKSGKVERELRQRVDANRLLLCSERIQQSLVMCRTLAEEACSQAHANEIRDHVHELGLETSEWNMPTTAAAAAAADDVYYSDEHDHDDSSSLLLDVEMIDDAVDAFSSCGSSATASPALCGDDAGDGGADNE